MLQHGVAETRRELICGDLTGTIIGAAIEVHSVLGPGLLESAYDECLCQELHLRNLDFRRQVELPVEYKGLKLDCGLPNRHPCRGPGRARVKSRRAGARGSRSPAHYVLTALRKTCRPTDQFWCRSVESRRYCAKSSLIPCLRASVVSYYVSDRRRPVPIYPG